MTRAEGSAAREEEETEECNSVAAQAEADATRLVSASVRIPTSLRGK